MPKSVLQSQRMSSPLIAGGVKNRQTNKQTKHQGHL